MRPSMVGVRLLAGTPRSTAVTLQLEGTVGVAELRMLPASSTATHQVAGQSIPSGPLDPLISATVHALDPPVGSADHTALPRESTAAQNDAEGHEIAYKPCTPGMPELKGGMYSVETELHVAPPPVGLADANTLPS